jgi:hypothetical protein
MDFENRKWSNSVGLRIRPTTWREKRPKAGVAHGHAAVAHLAEPADVPSVCTRVVTTAAAGTEARVPQVDRQPRVATAVAQAPGGLRESVGHRFEDEDSLGRCGDGGAAEAGRNDDTRRRQRRYGGHLQRRIGL